MAISHSLDIQTSLSAKGVEQLLLSSNLGLGFIEGIEFIEDDTEFNNSSLNGLGISITPRKASKLAKEITLEDYGFIPDISIGFDMLRYESETAGMETTAKVLSILLVETDGDAVFFLNSDYIVFKSLNRKLIVYKEISEWLMPELDKARIKYEMEKSEYAEEFS